MAQGEATLVVKLIDQVSNGLKGIQGAISGLRKHWLAITSAMAGVTAAIAFSLKAYSEQEDAVNKLNTALRNQGIRSKAASDDLIKFAESLSKTSLFADETIIEMQALLTTFGLAGQPLKNTTKAALDLATGLGVDLRTATLLLGKAAAGETATLARYGIKIADTVPQGQKLAAVIDQINARFGGAAAAATKTFAGQVTVLKNQIGELGEKLGRLIVGPAKDFVAFLRKAVDGANDLSFSLDQWKVGRAEKKIESLRSELRTLADDSSIKRFKDAIWGGGFTSVEQKMDRMKEIVKEIANLQTGLKGKPGGPVGGVPVDRTGIPGIDEELVKEREKLAEQARTKIDQFTLTQDEIALKEAEHLEARLIANQQYDLAVELSRASAHQRELQMMDKRKQAGMQALSNLATFQNAKNKEMAAVGKAAAITQTTIDTYVGATAAYKALAGIPIVGPALGTAAAVAAIAAGLGRVAMIQGTPLAAGGLVLPTSGGTMAMIGEGGRSEAVIPLGDERAKRQMQETLGGGETNIYLHVAEGGVFVGDQRGVQELARLVDEELFRSGRNRKSVFKD